MNELEANDVLARKGGIMVRTGRMVDPSAMTGDDVTIEDIAHALACSNRFGGHVSQPYSVAQHSVLVAKVLPDELKLRGLLHDGHEAYVVDLPRPLKAHLPDYRKMEAKAEQAVHDHFRLGPDPAGAVRVADCRLLTTEARHFGLSWWSWYSAEFPPFEGLLTRVWGWKEAKRRFLNEFDRLWV